ncbi:MAG: UDP-N-acetylmuramoyl-L-alanine--D-glutamate ligase, partial [Planctomycetota bacterium]
MLGSLSGRRVVVMGLGRFGGGVGVTRHLVREGARVIVTDRGDESELVSSLSELASEIASGAVELALGGHRAPDFESADLVVANPAIPRPWADPYLRIATSAGVPVTTEIALTIDRIADPRRVTAVTGTVGKSTTAAMIAEAMRTTGHPVLLGGNIGG